MSDANNRIDTCFASATLARLVVYITAGDPHPDATVTFMHAMVDGGADVIELGVPFSDPMADGPVIQKANERALSHHVTLMDVLDMVAEFRLTNDTTPVILMGYLNPFEQFGYDAFAAQAKAKGVDGVIWVDMPPEESEAALPALNAHDLAPIFLVSPVTPTARVERIAKAGRGFVYYVSLKGVTGVKSVDTHAVTTQLEGLKKRIDLPVAVGFGIRTPEQAQHIAQQAQGVVIGSALVQLIDDHQTAPWSDIASRLTDKVQTYKTAMQNA